MNIVSLAESPNTCVPHCASQYLVLNQVRAYPELSSANLPFKYLIRESESYCKFILEAVL